MAPAWVGMIGTVAISGVQLLRHGDFGNRQRPCEAVKEVRRGVELSSGIMLMQQYSPGSLYSPSAIGGMITWFATGSLLQDLICKFMV